jgi:hypothetical protein
VRIWAALHRLVFQPERHSTPPAKPFDDGLVDIARLLATEESSHHDKDSRAIQGQGTVRRK